MANFSSRSLAASALALLASASLATAVATPRPSFLVYRTTNTTLHWDNSTAPLANVTALAPASNLTTVRVSDSTAPSTNATAAVSQPIAPFTNTTVLLSNSTISASYATLSNSTVATLDCNGVLAVSPKCISAETGYKRDFFYVGGRYIEVAGSTVAVDQLYVEKLTPIAGVTQDKPLVFFHGGGVSGTSWLNTPDNRMGFASYFIGKGYMVYIVDQTSVGRSSPMDLAHFPMKQASSVEVLEMAFTDAQAYNLWPQAKLHTQWPGNGSQGDPSFEQFVKAQLPFSSNNTAGESSMRASGCALLAILGPSYLISHSAGATYPILYSNDCGEYVAGNIALEGATIPFFFPGTEVGKGTVTRDYGLTNTLITYDPPITDSSELVKVEVGNDTLAYRSCYLQAEPARQLPKISAVQYLLITSESSPHATYDHCIIKYLKQAGGNPEWIQLASDMDIHGNGHFMHLELNNLDIAGVVHGWIQDKESLA